MKIEIELDELTADKMGSIERRGYRVTGVILEGIYGNTSSCIIDGGCVLWLSQAEYRELMHGKE